MKKVLVTILVILLVLLHIDICSAQTPKFKDVSIYKRGLGQVIYAVYTKTNSFQEMKNYGKNKSNKNANGCTIVYFFNSLKNTPNISRVGMDFDTRFNKYWIGGYFKYKNGRETFLEYPGRE